MIEFALPWVALLLPLPWLLRRLLPPATVARAVLYFPRALELGSGVEHGHHSAPGARARHLLLALAWLGLLCAAAGPRWLGEEVSLPTSGRDLMLAVDISESMQIEDLQLHGQPADRLSVVKAVVSEFLARREGDRVGLILFGSSAYLHAPLTFDRRTVGKLLSEAQSGFAGKQTAIGDALAIAIKRLRERPEGSRVLLLLTDGANTAGEVAPRTAADLAARAGLRVYTIGVGAEQMELPGLFGSRIGARRINPSADLDEETLSYIAETTGGRYFRARDQAELQAVYAELDRLEPIEQEAETMRPRVSLAHWPLGLALTLSLGMAIAQAWRNRPVAARRGSAQAGDA
jgi:Ca-activated chloride channel family protein